MLTGVWRGDDAFQPPRLWRGGWIIFLNSPITYYKMKDFNPTGIVSQVEKDGRVFQVQTEYLKRPRPKIKTSIISGGKVVDKVERTWDKNIRTEADLTEVEKNIKVQHRETLRKLQGKKSKARTPELSFLNFLRLWQKISGVKGIKNVLVSKDDGILLFSNFEKEKSEQLSRIIASANLFAKNLSFLSNVGGFQGGLLDFWGEKVTWIFHENKGWALILERGIDLDLAMESIKGVLRGGDD